MRVPIRHEHGSKFLERVRSNPKFLFQLIDGVVDKIFDMFGEWNSSTHFDRKSFSRHFLSQSEIDEHRRSFKAPECILEFLVIFQNVSDFFVLLKSGTSSLAG